MYSVCSVIANLEVSMYCIYIVLLSSLLVPALLNLRACVYLLERFACRGILLKQTSVCLFVVLI